MKLSGSSLLMWLMLLVRFLGCEGLWNLDAVENIIFDPCKLMFVEARAMLAGCLSPEYSSSILLFIVLVGELDERGEFVRDAAIDGPADTEMEAFRG